ncbi:MAG TPA: hypothetical protein VEG60_11225 [Candidatus Binatia bacterium]|nr:hypothetical protein [Candidatus Binatia bacterium]
MAKQITKVTLDNPLTLRSKTVAPVSFEPDVVAPYQYLTNYRRLNPVEPEKALMFAVLAEAVDTYQRYAFCKSSRGQAMFREVEAWFWDHEPDSLFSFLSICEVFGLDPAFLRRGLMEWTASRKRNTLPRKKIQLHLERGRARKPLNDVGKKAVSKYRRPMGSPTVLNRLASTLD